MSCFQPPSLRSALHESQLQLANHSSFQVSIVLIFFKFGMHTTHPAP